MMALRVWSVVRGLWVPVLMIGLAFLLLVGLLVRKLDRRGRLEAWLTKAPPVSERPASVWNRDVPGPVLGVIALLGLIVFSVVALYIYYPAPKEAFDEIVMVRAEAVTAVHRWGEQRFGKVRFCCIIAPENAPSLRLAARMGYRPIAETTYKNEPITVLHREP